MTADTDGLARFLIERTGEDIARWSPALSDPVSGHIAERMFAEARAKREIVERYAAMDDDGRNYDDVHHGRMVGIEDDVLPFLALPYAGHPDYREEWKP